MKIFPWIALAGALILAASQAEAATLNVVGGQLVGASNVNVNGALYDVQFLDGTCASLYNGCTSTPNDFTFTTPVLAVAASQALLDQVFIDGPAGQFDLSPGLTAGCSGTALHGCGVITPYNILYFYGLVQSAMAVNYNGYDPYAGDAVQTGSSLIDLDTTDNSGAVFAVWTPVPEPGSILLLVAGLALVSVRERRAVRW